MAKRRARKRPTPTNGRRLKGGWKTDYSDGCDARGNDGLTPLCGVLPAASLPVEVPQWREQVRHAGTLVADPDERWLVEAIRLHDSGVDWDSAKRQAQSKYRVAVRDKFSPDNGRTFQEIARYWAKKDRVTLKEYLDNCARSYGDAHKVKRAPLGRSLAFHQGLAKNDKKVESDALKTIQSKILYRALCDEVGKDKLDAYLSQKGASMQRLAWVMGARAR